MQKEKDSRPPWRSTGAGTMPNWDKPSKYQLQKAILSAKLIYFIRIVELNLNFLNYKIKCIQNKEPLKVTALLPPIWNYSNPTRGKCMV